MPRTRLLPLVLAASWLQAGCTFSINPGTLTAPLTGLTPRPSKTPVVKPGEVPDPAEMEETEVPNEPLPPPIDLTRPVIVKPPMDWTCDQDDPGAPPSRGGMALGAYEGQTLPNGWDQRYDSEHGVHAAIRTVDGTRGWACFQKFFPGATTIYLRHKARPSAAPSAWPSFEPWYSPMPVIASAPPPTGRTLIVSGTVYDERGATIDGATVTVRSLDASVPYMATVTTTEGSYVVNNVPEGANVEVTVTRVGHTMRRRVQSFQRSNTGEKNLLDFGGGGDGRAYFISDRPEVAQTSPAVDAMGVDPSKLAFRVQLSEALDADSREAFEQAFTIVPANEGSAIDEAGTVQAYLDVAGAEWTDGALAGVTVDRFPYVLRRNDTFLDSPTNRATARWNPQGTEMMLTFDGNLQADRDNAAAYQAVLFTPEQPIEDNNGNRLGTDAAGAFTWPAPGTLLCNVFRAPDLDSDGNPAQAWAQTHTSAVPFSMRRDDTPPKLTGLGVVEDGDDLRLELTFSEPMAAYVGSGKAHVDPTVYDLANYSFMVGVRSGDLTVEDLDGTVNVLPGGTITSMKAGLAPNREFQFDTRSLGAYSVAKGTDLAGSQGAVAIEVEPDAPSIVNIWFRNGARDGLLANFRSLKARASGLRDAAGNNITDSDADSNTVTSSI